MRPARRWIRLRHWRGLLNATERQLVLAKAHPGMLADLGDYLFARSSGHIGSFITLVTRGCDKAIRSGAETLTRPLLDSVRIDEAAETARHQPHAAFAAGKLTSSPTAAAA